MEMKRVLLKLSGEALAGDKKTGFDEATVKEVARQVKIAVSEGIEVGVVIGGGNFWRGRESNAIDRTKADQIGMLATVMNCIYVSEIFRSSGMDTQILTPFECGSMTKLFSKDRANKYFKRGMVVFFAGGTGHPYFSTDTGVALRAIEMEADCIIVCEGAAVSMTIRKLAQERGCTVITTPYDTYTAARLINQSMPISYFMKTENLITFEDGDFIDDIKDVMASKRHRDFPILDMDGKYRGMISRRNLLGARGKQLVLVDHNEKNQAVDGIENAEILEIIDHHKLGTVETIAPVFFRNQPLGCTATIVYQMYNESSVHMDKKIAGLLCSAIISDTLLFRSPTCTEIDKMAALALAGEAGIDINQYAREMFSAGSNLKSKTDDEIFYQDFKRFNSGKVSFGVGQISSLNADELESLKERLLPYLKKAHREHGVDMMFFMLTNILNESTILLYEGAGALSMLTNAFHLEENTEEARDSASGTVELPGVVSRKKQLIPAIMIACEE